MRNVLKVYEVELVAEGPVFIGSGREITKKEYAFARKGSIAYVFDPVKLTAMLRDKRLYNEYEKYILGSDKMDLGRWLTSKGISESEFDGYLRYKMDCRDAVINNPRELKLMEIVRDPYGNPYIPGSSLKGVLRTVLLANDIKKNPVKYRDVINRISRGGSGNKRAYLNRECSELETIFANVLKRDEKNRNNAVNDFMSGIVVSDSEPLELSDIILCQRTDVHVDGREKRLPMLRECIRPGTIVKFRITVDESICNAQKSYAITDDIIMGAVREFCKSYNEHFVSKFKAVKPLNGDYIWIGGSCGFATKTEIYQMYDHRDAVRIIMDIFDKTCVPIQHKHNMDIRYGVSPHICKTALYKNSLCEMGKCHISIKKL